MSDLSVLSMTARAQVSRESDGARLDMTITSLNGRFLDITMRLPVVLQPLEGIVRKAVAEKIRRGSVTVSAELFSSAENSLYILEPNWGVIESYLALREKLELRGIENAPLRFDDMLKWEGAIVRKPREEMMSRLERLLESVTRAACDALIEMEKVEGAYLASELIKHLNETESLVNEIESYARSALERTTSKLKERIARLASDELDPDRVAQEALLIAMKGDVTEETARIRSHIAQFRDGLDAGGVVGSRLHFLAQEMQREATTILSKLRDAETKSLALSLRENVERIKEQVRNVQ